MRNLMDIISHMEEFKEISKENQIKFLKILLKEILLDNSSSYCTGIYLTDDQRCTQNDNPEWTCAKCKQLRYQNLISKLI
jgi:hypothetical protein